MSLVNILDYNNELYGILNAESPFLFIPQVSAFAGIPHLIADGNFDLAWFTFPPGMSIPMGIVYLLLACGIIVSGRHLIRISGISLARFYERSIATLRLFPVSLSVLILLIILYTFSAALGGNRGLVFYAEGYSTDSGLDTRLRLDRQGGGETEKGRYVWQGYLEAPVQKEFTLYLKVRGTYEVRLGGTRIFYNDDVIPQHLPRNKVELTRGYYPLNIEYETYPGERAVFYMYWTVPGEARYIEPIDGEYLFPQRPGHIQQVFTKIKRHIWLLYLVLLLPVLIVEYWYRRTN